MQNANNPGADPGFLESGFICKKGMGFALLISSHFSKIRGLVKITITFQSSKMDIYLDDISLQLYVMIYLIT